MARNENCTRCSLYQSARHVCLWGEGTGEAFVIGEAPGRVEDRLGVPFVGSSGGMLRPVLEEHGLEDAYITNAVKCRPPDNRKPEPDEIAACRDYVHEEIATRQPKAVLLLGATAMRALVGKTKITEMNGQVVEKNGQTYVCAFHPAFILRDPSKAPDFRLAIKRYADVLRGEYSDKMPDWRPIARATFDTFINEFLSCDALSFDVETTGLQWWTPGFDINSIAFSLKLPDGRESNWSLALAWRVPGTTVDAPRYQLIPQFEDRLALLKFLVRHSRGKRIVAQNGKFDNLCLFAVYGLRFHLSSDTMLAHHLLDENASHGLKELARKYCGAPDYDLPLAQKLGGGGVTPKKFLGYNAADAAYTRRLDDKLMPELDELERWIYDRLTMPAARMFERIDANGLFVDLQKLNETSDEQTRLLAQVEKELNRVAGREVNWNAPAQVARVLYEDLGLTPTVLTDKGNPSTGEEAIIDLDHPIGKLLEKYRMHSKFLSTYVGYRTEDGSYAGGWRSFMVGPMLYLSTKLHGTVTGRYSSRLHQVPRDGTVRNIVTAPPGWTFVQMDLSQAELRIVAIVARDPVLLDLFTRGIDVHWNTLLNAIHSGGGGEYADAVMLTARKLTKKRNLEFVDAIDLLRDAGHEAAIDIWPGWKEGRKKAKGINFGFVYGQQPPGFVTYAKVNYGLEVTLAESQQFREAFFHTYYALPAWHDRQVKAARVDGFVRDLMGYKRHLPGIDSREWSVRSECERQAINAPIQGFIGRYKTMIMLDLYETFDWDVVRMVGEVHDSILMWIRTDQLEDVLPQLKEHAEHPALAAEAGLTFPIPLTVDIEIGPWGKGKRWEPK